MRRSVLSLATALLSACGDAGTEPAPATLAPVLEIEVVDVKTGATTGFFVGEDGRVFPFNATGLVGLASGDTTIEPEALRARYGTDRRNDHTRIDSATVATLHTLLDAALNGIIEHRSGCPDHPFVSYYGYLPRDGAYYRRELLGSEGYIFNRPHSDAADRIARTLARLQLVHLPLACRIFL